MRKLLIPLIGIIAIGCASGGEETPTTTTTTAPPADTGPATFAMVAQTASANCMPCHNAEKKAGGLSLASYADVVKGGESGPVVKAGDPDGSLLIKVLKGPVIDPEVPRMPLKRDPLSADQIQKIADWIKAGAKEA
jgi:hypothetical protein